MCQWFRYNTTTPFTATDYLIKINIFSGLIVAGTVFLLAQLAVIAVWTYLYQRRRKQRAFEESNLGSTPTPTLPGSRADSMCKLYDSGFSGRHTRQF